MIALFFLYGLAFFSLGLAAAIETRRSSQLPLGKTLSWLAAFGFIHAAVEWIDMFLLVVGDGPEAQTLQILRAVLLPLSALALVRFGIGLINETRPLPNWYNLTPLVLIVPAGLLVAYALIVSINDPPLYLAADVWSRYLLYLPGCLLAAVGFFRQRQELNQTELLSARPLLLGAGLAFLFNALVAGLIVPSASYGLAPWLNYDVFIEITGIPVQVLRMVAAFAVTILVLRSLDVFEAENQFRMRELEDERQAAQQEALETQKRAREVAEIWIDALVSISRHIADMESVDATLLMIVDVARGLLGSDSASLALWDEPKQNLNLKYVALDSGTELIDSIPVKSELIREVVGTMDPFRYPEDLDGRTENWVCPLVEREIRAAAIVPLHLDGNPVGGLWLGRFNHIPFTNSDLIKLARLADQAVIAVEHALMASHLQSLAVIEERGRIAREMHDGLAQLLGYLNLELQTLTALVKRGDSESVFQSLQEARKRVQTAQDDVRENILSLRTTLSGNSGTVSALKEYVQEFGFQTGIEVEFNNQVDGQIYLSPFAETQLVRIVQEALTNVRKHAQARKLLVSIECAQGRLTSAVIDDGVGFSSRVGGNHFGLVTMRERAESAGGGLQIISTPGVGTQVYLWLPLTDENGTDLAAEPIKVETWPQTERPFGGDFGRKR